MDKTYNHKNVEERIYKEWEESGYFKPEVHSEGKPYSIILPPPNANAPLHFGHAMYSIEDILTRFYRMKGFSALWLPGADHAGFETQFVFEKHLAKEGKSRFDYDREALYKMIWDFVHNNRPIMENQLRKLGFSLDWSRKKFTLDPDIIKIVYATFKKLYDSGLAYRGLRLVNYCTKDGTSFSDLEVVYEERKDPLYYIKYGPLVLATTRPETKFGDTAVAVNPKDKRYQEYVGKEIEIETVLGPAKIKVIADESVDMEFGTGVVKITPAHDFNDFEVGERHNLPIKQVIDFKGRLNEFAGKFAGLPIRKAREAIIEEMKKKGLVEKIDENYEHRVGVCYKCKTVIEPLPMEQWFIKMKPLAEVAIEKVKRGEIKIWPSDFEKRYFQFLENIRDWNVSRQIVWGIRIPAYKCKKENKWFVAVETPRNCEICKDCEFEQDNDVFDTWFSSSQWPFATLQTTKPGDFELFYPTSVMETGYEILPWWVARMVMIGTFITGRVPFENVVLHGMVRDPLGQKMSKSKGNVVNPMEIVDQYGADAVRFSLVYGSALGTDQALSYPKFEAARKFTNKIWNMARFIEMKKVLGIKYQVSSIKDLENFAKHENDKKMVEETQKLAKEVTEYLEKYDFNHAFSSIYEFSWHVFADKYIEDVKTRLDDNSYIILYTLYSILLKLLHPFMPFVTEEIYQNLGYTGEKLIIAEWPSV